MIYNKRIATQVIGCLFKKPTLLTQTDKYQPNVDDFTDRLHRIVFTFLNNMFESGAEVLQVTDFVKHLQGYPEYYSFFEANKGVDFLLTAMEIAELDSFDYYYSKNKKLTLLRQLQDSGFDISDWYIEESYDISKRQELEYKLDLATTSDILESIQTRLLAIEAGFINKRNFSVGSIMDGLEEYLEELTHSPEMGLQLNGDILSSAVRGARPGKVYSLSAKTGEGKTRFAVATACKLAFPIRWNSIKNKWDISGSNQRILFVTTELDFSEIQTIVLANISGINESKILDSEYSTEEKKRIQQAKQILKYYEKNFTLYHMPDPTIGQLNNNIRRYVKTKKIDSVFFDYIHTSPNLLAEFTSARVREDIVLMLMSTALKNLANELGIFIWTGTQVNAKADEYDFADETILRGSRAIADKLDVGLFLKKATREDLDLIKPLILQNGGIEPNFYIDIFKARRSPYKRHRIWINLDLGTGRSVDLYLTDEYGSPRGIDIYEVRDASLKDLSIEEVFQTKLEKEERRITL